MYRCFPESDNYMTQRLLFKSREFHHNGTNFDFSSTSVFFDSKPPLYCRGKKEKKRRYKNRKITKGSKSLIALCILQALGVVRVKNSANKWAHTLGWAGVFLQYYGQLNALIASQ